MRPDVVGRTEEACWKNARLVGHEDVGQHHVATHGPSHAHRIPLALEFDPGRVLRDREVERTVDPGAGADQEGGRRKVVGCAGQRHEELPPADHVPAGDPFRAGPETPPTCLELVRRTLLDRLAVRLTVQDAVLDDLAEQPCAPLSVQGTRLVGERHLVGDLAHLEHGRRVHVVAERGRGVALRDLLGDEAVGLEACARDPRRPPGRTGRADPRRGDPGSPRMGRRPRGRAWTRAARCARARAGGHDRRVRPAEASG